MEYRWLNFKIFYILKIPIFLFVIIKIICINLSIININYIKIGYGNLINFTNNC